MAVYGASRLAGVHADLVRLVTDIGKARDVQVVVGARSFLDEQTAIKTGHSKLKNPADSLHVILHSLRPVALAVDLAPWPVDWLDIPRFKDFAAFLLERAGVLEIGIRWGGSWGDYDHFELAANGQCHA
jgi:hypothetical protein